MRRVRPAAGAATVVLTLALAPGTGASLTHAGGAAVARSSGIVQSIWKLTGASGTQTLDMSGADPDQGLDSVKAHVVTHWRTTTHSALMTFGWPAQKITRDFGDPQSFAALSKVKVEMIGSASGTVDVNGAPTPFACNRAIPRAPEGLLPAGGMPLTGGALPAGRLGIGSMVRSNPEVLLDGSGGPNGLSVHAIISPEQIEFNKPAYKPIPDRHVQNGHQRQRMNLDLRVTVPIVASTGAKIGSVTSTATLHLVFVQAV
jgi:hypothetical protein